MKLPAAKASVPVERRRQPRVKTSSPPPLRPLPQCIRSHAIFIGTAAVCSGHFGTISADAAVSSWRTINGSGVNAEGSTEESVLEPVVGPDQVSRWIDKDDELDLRVPSAWPRIRGPIGTVCVTGADRIGKSTLLTLWGKILLGNKSSGAQLTFPAGHTRNSHTQGLWSAILQSHATGLEYHLNLCDSQGLKQADALRESRLFSANVLIPHVLVYMVINVIQRDQIHDLARMARRFKTLPKNELSSFGRVLSPHLIVVIREESDLDGEGIPASDHLEEVLAGPSFAREDSFAAEKELIRNVFQTREALVLRELPLMAQRRMRLTGSPGQEGIPWETSGIQSLERVRLALDTRRAMMPYSGRDLGSWYKSVLLTVNSQDENSLGHLVGHGERLAAGRHIRSMLEQCGLTALFTIISIAVVTLVSGAFERWLDLGIWLGWILCWNCYVGMSPFLTTPFEGLVPMVCDQFFGAGISLLRSICTQASPATAAVLLATILALLSYPVFTAQLRWLARLLLPLSSEDFGRWNRLAALILVAFVFLISHEVAAWDNGVDSGETGLKTWSFAARLVLSIITAFETFELVAEERRNRFCTSLSEKAIALHSFVAERVSDVHLLESTTEWNEHYAQNSRSDALWGFRRRSLRRRTLLWLQDVCLLAWGILIQPNVDLVLAIGALANTVRFACRILRMGCGLLNRALFRDGVSRWYNSHDDASSADSDDEGRFFKEDGAAEMQHIPETSEDKATRVSIEQMRRAQESQLPRKPHGHW
eukprot:TRINITY_DN68947_c0_g1_i1.p1 TRINITY_DN68947_c0_g1~~TRINITY_DN68947_c0_g1_i1.p1  ORF type:complete len:766 (+),score=76.78 TRINITY_DN68947_c0_g1_i1:184-2481(+)